MEREREKEKKKKEKGWSNVMHANEGSEYLCKARLSLMVRNSIYILAFSWFSRLLSSNVIF